MARILNIPLTTTPQYVDLTGPGLVQIYIDGDDLRYAYDAHSADNGPYFPLLDGTTYVYDRPNPFVAQAVYIRTETGTATLYVDVMGGGIQ